MQQCLPLAVLKLTIDSFSPRKVLPSVATVLTACGIETIRKARYKYRFYEVATVLTACGIETGPLEQDEKLFWSLQQCLPLAVLKLEVEDEHLKDITGCNSAYRLRY